MGDGGRSIGSSGRMIVLTAGSIEGRDVLIFGFALLGAFYSAS